MNIRDDDEYDPNDLLSRPSERTLPVVEVEFAELDKKIIAAAEAVEMKGVVLILKLKDCACLEDIETYIGHMYNEKTLVLVSRNHAR